MNTIQIYEVKFLTREITLPSMSHVNTFLNKYDKLLTPELLNSMRIVPLTVLKNSDHYKTAIHNSICLKA